MNREILFRGKRLDNREWVYGSLVQMLIDGRIAFCICPIKEAGRTNKDVPPMGILFTLNEDIFLVDPATVGQFTGAIDKNGKKIFEGDIVKTDYHIARVVYEEVEWRLYISNNSYRGLSNHIGNDYYIEVLGNIHDNPDLLKGGTK